ncbi:MAG TPA: 50S ribosomal protein L3 [Gemmatimonadaceae bacterium]
MIGIIGKKLGMTQLFNEAGQQIPCTVIEAEPNSVLAVTSTSRIKQVQLGGLGVQKNARTNAKGEHTPRGRRVNNAELGHAKKAGLDAAPRVVRSVRLDEKGNSKVEIPVLTVGELINVGVFSVGETVKVTGTTKGRGFQGVVKRWNFGGGPNTHGNTKHRRPGSIGPGTDPSRVIKGKKMPGHFGAERHTQIGLRVEKIDLERNLIYVRGPVPGPKSGIVVVRKQDKP